MDYKHGYIALLIASLVMSACAASPHGGAGSQTQAVAACLNADDLGGRAASLIRYRALSGSHSINEVWMTFPCGQTAKHEEYVSGNVEPVLPCGGSRDWNCFENRLPSVSGRSELTNVYFAIPKNFKGGSEKWTSGGVEFQATPVSNKGSDDISVITAHRAEGTVLPKTQEFVFSLEHGLITAMIIDERFGGVTTYVLAQRTGLFARSLSVPKPR